MSIKSVEVVPGCISCHTCESVCPGIFKVDPTSKVINHDYLKHAKEIFKAEKLCPVQVIKVTKDDSEKSEVELASGTVSNVEYLTPDTVELKVAAKGFSFKPGQYVSMFFKDAEGEFSRAYSIVSGDSDGFVLAIKLLPTGRGTKAIRAFKGGEKIKYDGGIGRFVLKDTPAHKVFVATGTGLAPMIAMLEAAPAETKKSVVFGVRNEEDLFYAERLLRTKIPKSSSPFPALRIRGRESRAALPTTFRASLRNPKSTSAETRTWSKASSKSLRPPDTRKTWFRTKRSYSRELSRAPPRPRRQNPKLLAWSGFSSTEKFLGWRP